MSRKIAKPIPIPIPTVSNEKKQITPQSGTGGIFLRFNVFGLGTPNSIGVGDLP